MGLGTGEIILIFIVLMVLFGAKKLPQLGDGLGKALRGIPEGHSWRRREAEGRAHRGGSRLAARAEVAAAR
jgi:sec-independent protein translocase protein TatA